MQYAEPVSESYSLPDPACYAAENDSAHKSGQCRQSECYYKYYYQRWDEKCGIDVEVGQNAFLHFCYSIHIHLAAVTCSQYAEKYQGDYERRCYCPYHVSDMIEKIAARHCRCQVRRIGKGRHLVTEICTRYYGSRCHCRIDTKSLSYADEGYAYCSRCGP